MDKFYTLQDSDYKLTYNLTENEAWDIMNKHPNRYKVFEQIPPREMTSSQRKAQKQRDEAHFNRNLSSNTKSKKPKRNSLPSKKTKWIGNMWKHSATSLKRITKTGTKKQKALARKILNKRRKK